MTHHTETASDTKLLWEKIKGVRIAMMTTEEADGTLRSRPMATQEMEFDGSLWFFTQASASKVDEVQQHRQINLSYVKVDDNLYVSVSGAAELVRDRQKIKEYWKPFYKAWFPNGEDDPDLALLKVTVSSAEYWDAPSGKMGMLYSVVKGLATGSRGEVGEHKQLDLS